MRKIIILLSFFVSLAVFAQENSDTMFIYRGTTVERILVSEVDSVTFVSPSTTGALAKPELFTPEAVDLGLSVKWATCNVGATKPEEYGGYYAWGETEEKSYYTDQTYKYWTDKNGDGDDNSGEYTDLGDDISGTQYDVAYVKWGASWRMSTKEEFQELYDKCSWEWMSVNGVYGQRVTGPNGNSIFLPAAGYRGGSKVYDTGNYGRYCSSTPYDGDNCYARGFAFDELHIYSYSLTSRYNGHSVRPVCNK